jgi:hypothetical protein
LVNCGRTPPRKLRDGPGRIQKKYEITVVSKKAESGSWITAVSTSWICDMPPLDQPVFHAAPNPKQLPTNHDLAVPSRVYQSDQSSSSVQRCHLFCLPKENGLDLPPSRKIQPAGQSIQKPVKPDALS